MFTGTLHFDHIPIERHWSMSMRLHEALGHTEPWELCHAGCDQLASTMIRELFGLDDDDEPHMPHPDPLRVGTLGPEVSRSRNPSASSLDLAAGTQRGPLARPRRLALHHSRIVGGVLMDTQASNSSEGYRQEHGRTALDHALASLHSGVGNADGTSAAALTSIAESLRLLIQPEPATRETLICFDCGKTAGPSCGYWGHGVEDLGSLMDGYDGGQGIQLVNAREELNLKDEALATVAEDRNRQASEIKQLRAILHSALGYLSAEDNPQARLICQNAALALGGVE